jgi:hypothetical protein
MPEGFGLTSLAHRFEGNVYYLATWMRAKRRDVRATVSRRRRVSLPSSLSVVEMTTASVVQVERSPVNWAAKVRSEASLIRV